MGVSDATVLRLTVYYVMVGILIMCLSALLPQGSIGPIPAEPPADMQGAIERFKGQVAVFPKGAPVWLDALFQMIAAFLLVLPLAFVYVRTRTRIKFDHSLIQTVIMLPIVVSAILVVVRDSLALAFSLAGIVAAVRFRNTLKESGDAVYIFGSIGIGFATGIHAISVAGVLSVVFVVVELALWKFDFSAEFERTFARLCLPSSADMADVPGSRGEPEPAPAGERGRAGASRPGRSRPLRAAPDLCGPGGCRASEDRGGAGAGREALDTGADRGRHREHAAADLSGAGPGRAWGWTLSGSTCYGMPRPTSSRRTPPSPDEILSFRAWLMREGRCYIWPMSQQPTLRPALGPLDLTMLGVGSVIGTGIFVLTGPRPPNAGPALVISMIVAAVACALAGLCYAELAAMIPVAGSAYTYAYATLGEFVAWIIGWDLILEYALSASTVAVGWSGYFVSLLRDLGCTPAGSPPRRRTAVGPAAAGHGVFNLPAMVIVLLVAALLVIGIRRVGERQHGAGGRQGRWC